MRFLDPRFHLVAVLIDDVREMAAMRCCARRHAEMIAAECGFTFAEALAKAGIRLREQQTEPEEHEPQQHEPEESELEVEDPQMPAEEPQPAAETDGQIAAVLKADPSRSDRDIARQCGASPTTVGKARRSLGLAAAVRNVIRRGKPYGMQIGERS